MADIVKIPTANLGFSTTVSSKKLFSGDCDNVQPEIVAETENTYISKTMRNVIEITKANLGLTTINSWNSVGK